MGFDVIFAGKNCCELGLMVVQRPNLSAPIRNITVTSVPGRVSSLSDADGSYDDFTIPVEFNYVARPDRWAEVYRQSLLWLRQTGHLEFSDDPGVFYKVRYVTIGDNERSLKRIGKFTASFVCQPGTYYKSGTRYVDVKDKIINAYSVAQPVYEITGTGECALTVNGKTMNATVEEKLYIDTERLIAYKDETTSKNTALSGDYEDMYLTPGENTIFVSPGFTVRVQPNWRVL